MAKCFNVTGPCNPRIHYMVDITDRLRQIKQLVDDGKYFTINRARQYGKTTTIKALAEYLKEDYIVISLDFQALGNEEFETAGIFSRAFIRYLMMIIKNRRNPVTGLEQSKLEALESATGSNEEISLRGLFELLSGLCDSADRPVVMIIDEVDSASNNQVFLDFLAQLRNYYLNRDMMATFQSVILVGVYDVKNIRQKIRPDDEHKYNSPWNIAADFPVNMSFNTKDIEGMLRQYESDYNTGMDIEAMAEIIAEYTSGYPFLVSRLCMLMDEQVTGSDAFSDKYAAWTRQGFLEAVKIILMEKNTLFESLMGKLYDYHELKKTIYTILFAGKKVLYNPDERWTDIASMFGLVRNDDGIMLISNRIFEMRLYNYFLATSEAQHTRIFQAAACDKNQYISGGHLDMALVLNKFVEHYDQIYGDNAGEIDEEEGRRRFLLYLRPIINGTGNYYIEAETRNDRRMDVVVDYLGEQFIIELKIWRGNAYNERGEKQLSDYLDYFHLKKGYMLSYNFNKNKNIGVREIDIDGRILVEAVV